MFASHHLLMNASVEHWLPPVRDIHGKATSAGSTSHRARVTYGPAKVAGPASSENMPDAKATIWLLNHPRPIAIGDTFTLPNGETLNVIRTERRSLGAATISKAYLS